MNRDLWEKITTEVIAGNEFFWQKPDGLGRMGFHGLHKCVVAMRMLAYGSIADALDDAYEMAESTVLKCVKEFASTIIELYEKDYLRPPTETELATILAENKARGFPGMLGSIDCMHWEWAACPVGWLGQFQGRKGKATLILEAVATKDLRVWHAFFGMPGSCNDINVLNRSPVFDALAQGRTPAVNFEVNGNNYSMGYYLADKIYPDWATLVKTKSKPQNPKDENFAKAQESCRKDVERFFGVFKSKCRIIYNAGRLWSHQDMNTIMKACLILHNMIVENERGMQSADGDSHEEGNQPDDRDRFVPEVTALMEAYEKIQDRGTSNRLQQDLVDHHWMLKGNELGPYARGARQ